jgi:uncharacterized membrane protein
VSHRTARLGPPGPPDHPSDHRVLIIVAALVVLVLLGIGTGQLLGRVLAAAINALLGVAGG